jgi:hypothetical protein
VDIFITKDIFCTLMDIVTFDLIRMNIVQQASTRKTHAVTMAIQEKT